MLEYSYKGEKRWNIRRNVASRGCSMNNLHALEKHSPIHIDSNCLMSWLRVNEPSRHLPKRPRCPLPMPHSTYKPYAYRIWSRPEERVSRSIIDWPPTRYEHSGSRYARWENSNLLK